jgi:hypothetical protein
MDQPAKRRNAAARSVNRIILLLLLAALVLLISGAAQKSYWEDEAWTATQSVKTAAEIVKATAADRHPPLYFLAAGAWSRVFGTGEVGLRSLSILFSLGSLYLVYRLAHRFSGGQAALAAMGLLCFSPFVLMYGHTARYYALAMLLGLGAVHVFLRYLDTRRLAYLLAYVILGAALLYTSYPTLGILLACNLWWLFIFRKNKDTWLPWLTAQALVAVAFLPWLPVLTAQAQKDLLVQPQAANLALEIAKRAGYLAYAFGLGETISPLNPAAWLGVLALLGMALLALRATRGEAWFPLLVFVCLVVVNIAISLVVVYPVAGWQGIPNRMLYGLPFLMIWLTGWIIPSKPRWLALPVVMLVVYLLAGFNYFTGREFIKPFLDVPWRLIMQLVEQRSTGEVAVVCGPGEYACFYYARLNGYDALRPNDWQQVEQAGYDDVWWVRSNLGEPDRESGGEVEGIVLANKLYWLSERANFARQADSLRWLKTRFLGQLDYEYRVNLFHFVRVEPRP